MPAAEPVTVDTGAGLNDRRHQPRVEWTSEAVAAFGSREVRLRTRDLSVGGCCVETQLRPPTGERVGLVLHVDGAPVGTWAEVAWSTTARDQSGYVWGLRFVELEDDSAARLAAYVDHCFAVDMLDELLRNDSSPISLPDAPAFTAGDLEEVPTRLHRQPSMATAGPEFFPTTGGAAYEGEATSEIDVESTLTSEVPHTHTVQVDLADLYRQAEQARGLEPTATLAAGWDLGPEPIGTDAPAWDESADAAVAWDCGEPSFGWDAPSVPSDVGSLGWDSPRAQSMPLHVEPLAAEPFEQQPAAHAAVGDPFWTGAPEFPTHAPVAWPTAQTPEVAHAGGGDANAFAKSVPFDAPPQQHYPQQPQQQYYDPSAFDPAAFEPEALASPQLEVAIQSVPSATQPVLTVELAPMTPADLLELKRKRIEALLASVPRRASAPESASKANTAKVDVPTDKAKRPRTPTGPRPAGLRELFDEALRELGRED